MPYYCDHNAYASVLGTTPTWGVPQEGDGSSKDAATTAGTAAIVFTAPIAAGNTITLCGVVFTAVASGATGNQFNVGGSLTLTIDNLVAAINASLTTVASGVAVGTPQLRNLVFARNTSGTTLEVMMRIGSAALNGANNTNCRMTGSGISTSTSLPVDFAGGVGGCWGIYTNTAAMGAGSVYAALSYGLLVHTVPLVAVNSTAPTVAALPTIADPIYARTGSGITITCAANGAPNLGQHTYGQNIVWDTNTIWTGDSGTGQVTLATSMAGADVYVRLTPQNTGVFKIMRALRQDGFRIQFTSSTNGQGFLFAHTARSGTLYEGVAIESPSTFNPTYGNWRLWANGYCAVRFRRCSFRQLEPRTTFTGFVYASNVDGSVIFEGCTFTANHTGGSEPGTITQNANISTGSTLRFIGCKFTGWAFGRYRVFPSGMGMSFGSEAVAEGCTGINLGTAYVGLSTSRLDTPNYATVVTHSLDSGQAYRYEYGAGVVDWNPDAAPAYPTRSALLGDNTTPWSVKLDWFNNVVNPMNVLSTPRMSSINRLSAGARTVAVDFLTPITLTAFDVAIRVHYIGTDGTVYTESTIGKASALTSPGATWTGSSNWPTHNSRRLTLTTSNSVKANTEIAVYFEVTGNPPGGSGVQLFIDPEFALS